MPAYHSAFNKPETQTVCGLAFVGVKTKFKGPAPRPENETDPDIVEEALDYFKANVLFRNYDVQGPGDKLLCYLTWFISSCLAAIPAKIAKSEADRNTYQLAMSNFVLPGEKNFILAGLVSNPKNRNESEQARAYLLQLRQETALRLVQRIYQHSDSEPSKWWMCFSKRKFLNKTL